MSAKSDGPPLPVDPGTIDPDPDPGATYWADGLRDRPRFRPNDHPNVVGIRADPTTSASVIGFAHLRGYVGGVDEFTRWEDLADAPPPEVVWELVLDRVWVDGRIVSRAVKLPLDGRFFLRLGRFVGVAEDVG